MVIVPTHRESGRRKKWIIRNITDICQGTESTLVLICKVWYNYPARCWCGIGGNVVNLHRKLAIFLKQFRIVINKHGCRLYGRNLKISRKKCWQFCTRIVITSYLQQWVNALGTCLELLWRFLKKDVWLVHARSHSALIKCSGGRFSVRAVLLDAGPKMD